MAILDNYGKVIQYKAARAATNSQYTSNNHRPWEPIEKKDIEDLIPQADRISLLSQARRIYINFGPIKNAINQRSMYSVGRAFVPKYTGMDSEFGDAAAAWLNNTFYQIGDSRGGMHDFKTNLFTWSTSLDVDGEVFILLTQTKEGFPQYQGIPSHRIATPNGVREGFMRGGELKDGIIYLPSGTPKEYAFVDKKGMLIEWIPAQNLIHLFNPEWQGQGRGLSGLTHCINDCRDIIQSTDWERLAMMQMSSISLIEYNESGGADANDPRNMLLGGCDTNEPGIVVESMDGGTVRYFKSNSGGKIETLVNNRPGNPFMDFHDRLLKSAFAGLDWPYAFYNGHGAGGGTAQRTEIAMAQRAIEDRQDLLFYAAKRIVSYAVAKAQKRGDLPQSPDWYKWDFSTPPKLTIDDGRVMKELESAYKLGFKSAGEITAAMGKDYADVVRQKAEEAAIRQVIKAEIEQKYGIKIDAREIAMMTPNDQPDAALEETEKEPKKEDEDSTN